MTELVTIFLYIFMGQILNGNDVSEELNVPYYWSKESFESLANVIQN